MKRIDDKFLKLNHNLQKYSEIMEPAREKLNQQELQINLNNIDTIKNETDLGTSSRLAIE